MDMRVRIDGVSEGQDLVDLLGGQLEIVARVDTPDADAVVMRASIAPGGGVPLHSHGDFECFHVISGRLDVFVEPHGWIPVEMGQSAVLAHGERHALRNATAEAVHLSVVVNNRLARFFQEAGTPGRRGALPAPPTPEKIMHLLSVADRYGYWMANPAEHAAATG